VRTVIIVPVKDSVADLARCLGSLSPCLNEQTQVVVVDDGSRAALASDPLIAPFAAQPGCCILRHPINRGPGAARNTGIAWAREQGAELVILLDADCRVEADFADRHRAIMARHPGAACAGGAILGEGRGIWAWLDGKMSWFTSLPGSAERAIRPPYHIPTTNMSLRLAMFPAGPMFDERLRTGEDVAFIADIRARRHDIVFAPQPQIIHSDRATLAGFFRHQYRWGLHTYVVRRGPQRLDRRSRAIFFLIFLLGCPAYALLATGLNLLPLLRRSPLQAGLAPILLLAYLVKAAAVLDGTLFPEKALFPKEKHGLTDA
jgi:glycosyltransferase involved in cell wall biosynthesis